MLTIENIYKIVGRKIPIQSSTWVARIKDVYCMVDNTYIFEIQTQCLRDVSSIDIKIILDRKPPRGVYSKERQWELSWEIGKSSNQYETQLVSSKVVRDMSLFGMALGTFTDIIIHS